MFQSPTGNIACQTNDEAPQPSVYCTINEHSWGAPAKSSCPDLWGDRIGMIAGQPATFACHHDDFPAATFVLQYGQENVAAGIHCLSDYHYAPGDKSDVV
jgi:hypothetical protein